MIYTRFERRHRPGKDCCWICYCRQVRIYFVYAYSLADALREVTASACIAPHYVKNPPILEK